MLTETTLSHMLIANSTTFQETADGDDYDKGDDEDNGDEGSDKDDNDD